MMLHIVLLILKIILIIIAVLLGIILLAVLAVLFVPVRYKISGQYNDNVQCASARVSWFLHILSVKAEFSKADGFDLAVRLFGIRLNKDKGDAQDNDDSGTAKKSAKKRKKERNVFDEEEFSEADEKPEKNASQSAEAKKTEAADVKNAPSQEKSETEASSEEGKNDKPPKTKIRDKILGIKDKIIGIKDKILKLGDKISDFKNNTREKLDKLTSAINNEHYRSLVKFLWRQVKAFLKIIKPKKGRLYVRYGFDDPETTGKVTMYLAILYGIIGVDVKIVPDFNEKVLEGDVMLKGHIRLIGVAVIAVRCILNRDFRRYILKRK